MLKVELSDKAFVCKVLDDQADMGEVCAYIYIYIKAFVCLYTYTLA